MNCPLCLSNKISQYSEDKNREYYLCESCQLVFVTRQSILGTFEEKARYDTHENNENDPHYRAYMEKTVNEMRPFIKDGEKALDFGSGRTQVLAKLLMEYGLEAEAFDIYYFPHTEIWQKKFDVIAMSEVIEHLRDLRSTMEKLRHLLNTDGRFFIKTKLRPKTIEEFDRWYYRKDPTHVEFFHPESFEKMAEFLECEKPVFLGHDVVMLKASR